MGYRVQGLECGVDTEYDSFDIGPAALACTFQRRDGLRGRELGGVSRVRGEKMAHACTRTQAYMRAREHTQTHIEHTRT
jgi:hypothetical protein